MAASSPAERLLRLRAALAAPAAGPRAAPSPKPPLAAAAPEPSPTPALASAACPGGAPSGHPPPIGPLAERIQRLAARAHPRRQIEGIGRPAPPGSPRAPGDAALAAILGGSVHAPGVIAFVHDHPLDRPDVLRAADLQWLGLAGTPPRAADLCFIDTETSGLAGGCGTLPFLVGIARLCGDVLRVHQWLLTGFGGERAMLLALRAASADSGAWISYNGKSFDLPLLATRFALARLDPLPPHRPHADLLHFVRTAYGRQWPDCRLATAENRLLGVRRKDDLPGHAVPGVWTAFLREADAGNLPAVLLHNRLDLVSLAALLPALGSLFETAVEPSSIPGARLPPAADHGAIARLQLRRGRAANALRQLEAAPQALDERARLLHADLLRRAGRLDEALALWEDLAGRGVVPAVVALLRHDRRESGQALRALHWATRLRALEPDEPRHRRRVERLVRIAAQPQSLPLPGVD